MPPFESAPSLDAELVIEHERARELLRDALLHLAAGNVDRAREATAAAARLLDVNVAELRAPAAVVVVDADATAIRAGARESSLARRPALRTILVAILRAAIEGRAVSAAEALSLAWPGEPLSDAGLLRVYTAVRRLRSLGLEGVLVTRDDGYTIDAHIDVGPAGFAISRRVS
jgi:hypothetical protein